MYVLYFKIEDLTSVTLLFRDALVIRLSIDAWRRYKAPNDAVTTNRSKLHLTQRVWSLKSNASRYKFVTLDRDMVVDRFSSSILKV